LPAESVTPFAASLAMCIRVPEWPIDHPLQLNDRGDGDGDGNGEGDDDGTLS
jgi:hypothetical protein